jgi:hypothetical protein
MRPAVHLFELSLYFFYISISKMTLVCDSDSNHGGDDNNKHPSTPRRVPCMARSWQRARLTMSGLVISDES